MIYYFKKKRTFALILFHKYRFCVHLRFSFMSTTHHEIFVLLITSPKICIFRKFKKHPVNNVIYYLLGHWLQLISNSAHSRNEGLWFSNTFLVFICLQLFKLSIFVLWNFLKIECETHCITALIMHKEDVYF